ncbi:MAG TPA: lysophospholipid acyltransferase family protein, partial [Bacillota bacterium]|nr:lysophospholipid acyltransferase family protein [Bacillota bacterium]
FFQKTLGPFFIHLMNYECLSYTKPDAPFILLANHNTDFDPMLIGASFKDSFMYYVASDHILRLGVLSKLLSYYLAPIPRRKGREDALTVIEIRRRLKKGCSLCFFPEGNKSFNGVTGKIVPSTGELVRRSGVDLITFRFEGGYLTAPRWGYGIRKGKMTGQMVGVYTADQLKEMTSSQIDELISRDIFEDTQVVRKRADIVYECKAPAKGLENALYMCPNCRKIGDMHSAKDRIICKCGYEAQYTKKGQLICCDGRFGSIYEWDEWQRSTLIGSADRQSFSDSGVFVRKESGNTKGKKQKTVLSYSDYALYYECKNRKVKIDMNDISDMAIYGRSNLVLSVHNNYYLFSSKGRFNAKKYLDLYSKLRCQKFSGSAAYTTRSL